MVVKVAAATLHGGSKPSRGRVLHQRVGGHHVCRRAEGRQLEEASFRPEMTPTGEQCREATSSTKHYSDEAANQAEDEVDTLISYHYCS